jgi:hypothetical protein
MTGLADQNKQGDQIRRIFAYWAIVYFVKFFCKIKEFGPIYGRTSFSTVKMATFWAIFYELIWSS